MQRYWLKNSSENNWYFTFRFLAFFLYLSTNCEFLPFILFRKGQLLRQRLCFLFTLWFFFFRWTFRESWIIWVQFKDVAARHLQIIVATLQIYRKGFLYFTFYNICSLKKKMAKKRNIKTRNLLKRSLVARHYAELVIGRFEDSCGCV